MRVGCVKNLVVFVVMNISEGELPAACVIHSEYSVQRLKEPSNKCELAVPLHKELK